MKALSYTITITAQAECEENVGMTWSVISQEVDEKSGNLVPVYGYTPETKKVQKRDIKLFEQTVETLRIDKLVSVINGINI